MSDYLSLPKPPTIRITVVKRNTRWDVQQDNWTPAIIDFARREDALDYALGMAARSGDAIVETLDEQGLLLARRSFCRPIGIDAVSELARMDVAVARIEHAG